jgi:hypothetical protein
MITDLEITKSCAEAMGYKLLREGERCYAGFSVTRDCWITGPQSFIACYTYVPLHDDAQVMALFKEFPVDCWIAMHDYAHERLMKRSMDLNRAICMCIVNKEKHDR